MTTSGNVGVGPDRIEKRRILSIDIEDVIIANSEMNLREPPAGYRDTVAHSLRRTLELLDEAGAQATFFVGGRYCREHDGLLREAVAGGHVLASHGFHHSDIRKLSLREFRDDLRRSLDVLSRYQSDIIGYRPPAFTMPFDDPHLRILVDNGIRYVSCGTLVNRVRIPLVDRPVPLSRDIAYVPISIRYLLGGFLPYPVGYGHTSRLMPEGLCIRLSRRFAEDHDFFHFYFHPYEVPGLTRDQKRLLYRTSCDLGFLVYSRRSHDRSRLFRRILEAGGFRPIESLGRNADGSLAI